MNFDTWKQVWDYVEGVVGKGSFTAFEVCPVGKTVKNEKTGKLVSLKAPSPEHVRNALLLRNRVLAWVRNTLEPVAPVQVHSWYRDPEYNAAIPGSAGGSMHQTGAAADIVKVNMTPRQLALALHREHPDSAKLGIGLYRTFVHVDVRGLLSGGNGKGGRWAGKGVDLDWWQDKT